MQNEPTNENEYNYPDLSERGIIEKGSNTTSTGAKTTSVGGEFAANWYAGLQYVDTLDSSKETGTRQEYITNTVPVEQTYEEKKRLVDLNARFTAGDQLSEEDMQLLRTQKAQQIRNEYEAAYNMAATDKLSQVITSYNNGTAHFGSHNADKYDTTPGYELYVKEQQRLKLLNEDISFEEKAQKAFQLNNKELYAELVGSTDTTTNGWDKRKEDHEAHLDAVVHNLRLSELSYEEVGIVRTVADMALTAGASIIETTGSLASMTLSPFESVIKQIIGTDSPSLLSDIPAKVAEAIKSLRSDSTNHAEAIGRSKIDAEQYGINLATQAVQDKWGTTVGFVYGTLRNWENNISNGMTNSWTNGLMTLADMIPSFMTLGAVSGKIGLGITQQLLKKEINNVIRKNGGDLTKRAAIAKLVLESPNAARLQKWVSGSVLTALSAGDDATGASREVRESIGSMSFQDLEAYSEDYRALRKQGYSQEEARAIVALQAGNTAAAHTLWGSVLANAVGAGAFQNIFGSPGKFLQSATAGVGSGKRFGKFFGNAMSNTAINMISGAGEGAAIGWGAYQGHRSVIQRDDNMAGGINLLNKMSQSTGEGLYSMTVGMTPTVVSSGARLLWHTTPSLVKLGIGLGAAGFNAYTSSKEYIAENAPIIGNKAKEQSYIKSAHNNAEHFGTDTTGRHGHNNTVAESSASYLDQQKEKASRRAMDNVKTTDSNGKALDEDVLKGDQEVAKKNAEQVMDKLEKSLEPGQVNKDFADGGDLHTTDKASNAQQTSAENFFMDSLKIDRANPTYTTNMANGNPLKTSSVITDTLFNKNSNGTLSFKALNEIFSKENIDKLTNTISELTASGKTMTIEEAQAISALLKALGSDGVGSHLANEALNKMIGKNDVSAQDRTDFMRGNALRDVGLAQKLASKADALTKKTDEAIAKAVKEISAQQTTKDMEAEERLTKEANDPTTKYRGITINGKPLREAILEFIRTASNDPRTDAELLAIIDSLIVAADTDLSTLENSLAQAKADEEAVRTNPNSSQQDIETAQQVLIQAQSDLVEDTARRNEARQQLSSLMLSIEQHKNEKEAAALLSPYTQTKNGNLLFSRMNANNDVYHFNELANSSAIENVDQETLEHIKQDLNNSTMRLAESLDRPDLKDLNSLKTEDIRNDPNLSNEDKTAFIGLIGANNLLKQNILFSAAISNPSSKDINSTHSNFALFNHEGFQPVRKGMNIINSELNNSKGFNLSKQKDTIKKTLAHMESWRNTQRAKMEALQRGITQATNENQDVVVSWKTSTGKENSFTVKANNINGAKKTLKAAEKDLMVLEQAIQQSLHNIETKLKGQLEEGLYSTTEVIQHMSEFQGLFKDYGDMAKYSETGLTDALDNTLCATLAAEYKSFQETQDKRAISTKELNSYVESFNTMIGIGKHAKPVKPSKVSGTKPQLIAVKTEADLQKVIDDNLANGDGWGEASEHAFVVSKDLAESMIAALGNTYVSMSTKNGDVYFYPASHLNNAAIAVKEAAAKGERFSTVYGRSNTAEQLNEEHKENKKNKSEYESTGSKKENKKKNAFSKTKGIFQKGKKKSASMESTKKDENKPSSTGEENYASLEKALRKSDAAGSFADSGSLLNFFKERMDILNTLLPSAVQALIKASESLLTENDGHMNEAIADKIKDIFNEINSDSSNKKIDESLIEVEGLHKKGDEGKQSAEANYSAVKNAVTDKYGLMSKEAFDSMVEGKDGLKQFLQRLTSKALEMLLQPYVAELEALKKEQAAGRLDESDVKNNYAAKEKAIGERLQKAILEQMDTSIRARHLSKNTQEQKTVNPQVKTEMTSKEKAEMSKLQDEAEDVIEDKLVFPDNNTNQDTNEMLRRQLQAGIRGTLAAFSTMISEMTSAEKDALWEHLGKVIGGLNSANLIDKESIHHALQSMQNYLNNFKEQKYIATEETASETIEEAFNDEGVQLDNVTKKNLKERVGDVFNRIKNSKANSFKNMIKKTISDLGTRRALANNMEELIKGINLWAGDAIINTSWFQDPYADELDAKNAKEVHESSLKLQKRFKSALVRRRRVADATGEQIDQDMVNRTMSVISDPIKLVAFNKWASEQGLTEAKLKTEEQLMNAMEDFFNESGFMLDIIDQYREFLEKSGYNNKTLQEFAADIRNKSNSINVTSWTEFFNLKEPKMDFSMQFDFTSSDGVTKNYVSLAHAIYSNKSGIFDPITYNNYITKQLTGLSLRDLFNTKNITVQLPDAVDDAIREALEEAGVTTNYTKYDDTVDLKTNGADIQRWYNEAYKEAGVHLTAAQQTHILRVIASSLGSKSFVMMADDVTSGENAVIRRAMLNAGKDVYQYNTAKNSWYVQEATSSEVKKVKPEDVFSKSQDMSLYFEKIKTEQTQSALEARTSALQSLISGTEAFEVETFSKAAQNVMQQYVKQHPQQADFTDFSHMRINQFSSSPQDNALNNMAVDLFNKTQDYEIRKLHASQNKAFDLELTALAKMSNKALQRAVQRAIPGEMITQENLSNNKAAVMDAIQKHIESIVDKGTKLSDLMQQSSLAQNDRKSQDIESTRMFEAALNRAKTPRMSLKQEEYSVHQGNFEMLQNSFVPVGDASRGVITQVNHEGKRAYALLETDNQGKLKNIHLLASDIEGSIDALTSDPIVNAAYVDMLKKSINSSIGGAVHQNGTYFYEAGKSNLAMTVAGISNGLIKHISIGKNSLPVTSAEYKALQQLNERYSKKDADGNITDNMIVGLDTIQVLKDSNSKSELVTIPDGTTDVVSYLAQKFPGVPVDVLTMLYTEGQLYENTQFVLVENRDTPEISQSGEFDLKSNSVTKEHVSLAFQNLHKGVYDTAGNLQNNTVYVMAPNRYNADRDVFKHNVILFDSSITGGNPELVVASDKYVESAFISADKIHASLLGKKIRNRDGSTTQFNPFTSLKKDKTIPPIMQIGADNFVKWTEALRYAKDSESVLKQVRAEIVATLAETSADKDTLYAVTENILKLISPEGQFTKVYDALTESLNNALNKGGHYLSKNVESLADLQKTGLSALTLLDADITNKVKAVPAGIVGAMALSTLSVFSTVGAGIGKMQAMDALKDQLGLKNTNVSAAELYKIVGDGMLQTTAASLLTRAIWNMLGVKPNLQDATANTRNVLNEGIGLEVIAALTESGLLTIDSLREDKEGAPSKLLKPVKMVRLAPETSVRDVSLTRTSPLFHYLDGLSGDVSKNNWRVTTRKDFKPSDKGTEAEKALESAAYTADMHAYNLMRGLGILNVEYLGGKSASDLNQSMEFYQAQLEAVNGNIEKQIVVLDAMIKALSDSSGNIDPEKRIYFSQRTIETVKRVMSGNAESPQSMKLLRSVLNFGQQSFKLRDQNGALISDALATAKIALLNVTGHKTENIMDSSATDYFNGVELAYAKLTDPNSAWSKAVKIFESANGDYSNLSFTDHDIIKDALNSIDAVDAIEKPSLIAALQFNADLNKALANQNTHAFNTSMMVYVDGVAHGPSVFMQKFLQDPNKANDASRITVVNPDAPTIDTNRTKDNDLYSSAVNNNTLNNILHDSSNDPQEVAGASFAFQLMGAMQNNKLFSAEVDPITKKAMVTFARDMGKSLTTVNGAYNGGDASIVNNVSGFVTDYMTSLTNDVYVALNGATSTPDYANSVDKITALQKAFFTLQVASVFPAMSEVSAEKLTDLSLEYQKLMDSTSVLTKEDVTQFFTSLRDAYHHNRHTTVSSTDSAQKRFKETLSNIEALYNDKFDSTALGSLIALTEGSLGEDGEATIKRVRKTIANTIVRTDAVIEGMVRRGFGNNIVEDMWNTALNDVLGDQREQSANFTIQTQMKAIEIQQALERKFENGKHGRDLTLAQYTELLNEAISEIGAYIPMEVLESLVRDASGNLDGNNTIPIVSQDTVATRELTGTDEVSSVETLVTKDGSSTSLTSSANISYNVSNIGVGGVAKYIISKEAETMHRTAKDLHNQGKHIVNVFDSIGSNISDIDKSTWTMNKHLLDVVTSRESIKALLGQASYTIDSAPNTAKYITDRIVGSENDIKGFIELMKNTRGSLVGGGVRKFLTADAKISTFTKDFFVSVGANEDKYVDFKKWFKNLYSTTETAERKNVEKQIKNAIAESKKSPKASAEKARVKALMEANAKVKTDSKDKVKTDSSYKKESSKDYGFYLSNLTEKEKRALINKKLGIALDKELTKALKSNAVKRDLIYAINSDIVGIHSILQDSYVKNAIASLHFVYGDPNKVVSSGNFAGMNPDQSTFRKSLLPIPIGETYESLALADLGISEETYRNIQGNALAYRTSSDEFLTKAVPNSLTTQYVAQQHNIGQKIVPVIEGPEDLTKSSTIATEGQTELKKLMLNTLMNNRMSPVNYRNLSTYSELDKALLEAIPASLAAIFNAQGFNKMTDLFPQLHQMSFVVEQTDNGEGYKGKYDSRKGEITIALNQKGKNGVITSQSGKSIVEAVTHEAIHATVANNLSESINEFYNNTASTAEGAKIVGELIKLVDNVLKVNPTTEKDAGIVKLHEIIRNTRDGLPDAMKKGTPDSNKQMYYVLIQELLAHSMTTEGLGDINAGTGIYSRHVGVTEGLNKSIFSALWNLVKNIFSNIFGNRGEPTANEKLAVMDVVAASFAKFRDTGATQRTSNSLSQSTTLFSKADPLTNAAMETVLERNRLETAITTGEFFNTLNLDLRNANIKTRHADMVQENALKYFATMNAASVVKKLNTQEGQHYLEEAAIKNMYDNEIIKRGIPLENMLDMAPFAVSSTERYLFKTMYQTLGAMMSKTPEAKSQAYVVYAEAEKQLTIDKLKELGMSQKEAQEWRTTLFENSLPEKARFASSKDIATNNIIKFLSFAGSSATVMDMLQNLSTTSSDTNTLEGKVGKMIDSVGNFYRDTLSGVNLAEQSNAVFDSLLSEYGTYARRLASDAESSIAITPAGIFDNYVYGPVKEKMRASLFKQMQDYQSRMNNGEQLKAKDQLLYGAKTLAHSFLGPVTPASQKDEVVTTTFRSLINATGKENTPMSWWKQYLSEIWGQHKGNEELLAKVSIVKTTQDRARTMTVEQLPKEIISKFKTAPSAEDKAFLKNKFLDLDLAALYNHVGKEAFTEALNNKSDIASMMYDAMEVIAQEMHLNSAEDIPVAITRQLSGLSEFMHTNVNKTNKLQLPNAWQIARLAAATSNVPMDMEKLTTAVDKAVSAGAMYLMNENDRAHLSNMLHNEPEGMEFVFDYTNGLLKDTKENAKYATLAIKGGSYEINDPSKSLLTIKQSDWLKHKEQGATIVKDTMLWDERSQKDIPVFVVSSPIKQGVRSSGAARIVGDIITSTFKDSQDILNAYTDGTSESYKKLYEDILKHGVPTEGKEYPVLTLDSKGNMSASLSVSKEERAKLLNSHEDAFESMGRWAGRIQESLGADEHNKELVHILHKAYQEDMIKALSGEKGFITIDPSNPDPRVKEVWKLMPHEMRSYANEVFKGPIKVSKDNFVAAFGDRHWTMSDVFAKPQEALNPVEKALKNIFRVMFGDNAANYAIKGAEYLEEWVGILKHSTVVLNLGVQAVNGIGNMIQLMAEGVNPIQMQKDYALGLQEAEKYRATQADILRIQANIRAELGKEESKQNPEKLQQLYQQEAAERTKLNTNMVHPLMEAGMFSTIAQDETIGMKYSNIMGKFNSALKSITGSTEGKSRIVIENLLGVKGSATGNFLHLANQYTDFLPKFSLYLHKTQRSKNSRLTTKEAIHYVRDSFVDYNYNPGNVRAVAEKMGGTWFVNYASRIVKSASKLVRENPARALSLWGMTHSFGVPSLWDSAILGGHPQTLINPLRTVTSLPTTAVSSMLKGLTDYTMIGK